MRTFLSKKFIGLTYNIPFIKKKGSAEQVVTPDTTTKPKNTGTTTTPKTDSTKTTSTTTSGSSQSSVSMVPASTTVQTLQTPIFVQPAKKEKTKRKF